MDTKPLDMEAMIGRTGCHYKTENYLQHVTFWFCASVHVCNTPPTDTRIIGTLPQHPAAALPLFRGGSWPGFLRFSPRCRGSAGGPTQPRWTPRLQRNNTSSIATYIDSRQYMYCEENVLFHRFTITVSLTRHDNLCGEDLYRHCLLSNPYTYLFWCIINID